MRVLAIVQAWNRNDPVRGFTVGWIEALAERVDHVTVLANEQHHDATMPNITVMSLGREERSGRLRKIHLVRRWHEQMGLILAQDRPDVVFTHMSPVYSVLASPYAYRRRLPIITWFAHRHLDVTARAAHLVSTRIVTINAASYPIHAAKVVEIGHGIDTHLFSPGAGPMDRSEPLLLSVARISPIKDLGTFVRAIAMLRDAGVDATGAIVGGELARDRDYAVQIRELVAELSLDEMVEFVGPVPPQGTIDWYRRCSVHVNLCPTGALDKAALEAMACGRPSVVSNEAFAETLGSWSATLTFPHGDASALAERLQALLKTPPETEARMSAELRRTVVDNYSLSTLADNLVTVFEDARRAKSSTTG